MSTLAPLHHVLSAADRLVASLRPHDLVTKYMKCLHWLPIISRFKFKLYMVLFTDSLTYIKDVLVPIAILPGHL